MNRSRIILLIAVLLILFSSMSLGAQGRGRFGGGAGFNIPPVVRPGFSVGTRPFPVTPPRAPGFGVRPVHPINPVRPSRQVVVPPVFGFYSPYIWPSTIYDPYAYSLYSNPAYSQPAYDYQNAQPAVSQNELDLAYQVGQLSAQVEQLKQQQQGSGINSYTQPSAQPQGSAGLRTPTVLAFRDGTQKEIQNYAIVEDTLWVFDGNVAAKISLSDLDIDATKKANGPRFLLPQK